MTPHCKGCRLHNNSGWGKKAIASEPARAKFNDWCCKFGQAAKDIAKHCKLHNAKEALK